MENLFITYTKPGLKRSSPEFFFVIFMQNVAILGNAYLCINERIELPILKPMDRDVGEASKFII